MVFDPATVQDHSTYERPQQLATGVDDVWVNGVRALRDGKATGAASGRAVRGRAWTGAAAAAAAPVPMTGPGAWLSPAPMMTAGRAAAPRDRWYVLAILTVVYALNIADRFSISTLIEPIRQELHLSDRGIAFLTGGALAMFYVTVGIPVAALADHANRRNILAVALALWSGMTALCGLAQSYLQLLLARFGVGIGEAGGTPPSTSMLADNFPPGRRPMALTIFALGACLGAWLGS